MNFINRMKKTRSLSIVSDFWNLHKRRKKVDTITVEHFRVPSHQWKSTFISDSPEVTIEMRVS